VSEHAERGTRRYDFPPLWTLPLLVLAAITLIVFTSLTIGLVALIPAIIAIAWIQRKADSYVRRRQADR
jgi:hypothetical protein